MEERKERKKKREEKAVYGSLSSKHEDETSVGPVCGKGKRTVEFRHLDNMIHTKMFSLNVCIQENFSLFTCV